MFSKIKEVNGVKNMSYKVYCSAAPYEWNFSTQLTDMIDGQIDQGVDEYGDDVYYGEIREATLVNIIVEHVEMMLRIFMKRMNMTKFCQNRSKSCIAEVREDS